MTSSAEISLEISLDKTYSSLYNVVMLNKTCERIMVKKIILACILSVALLVAAIMGSSILTLAFAIASFASILWIGSEIGADQDVSFFD